MKRLFAIGLLLIAVSSFAVGQTTNKEAVQEINEGASAYHAGNYAEAQRHFERALELDPAQKNAPLFIARAIHQQYKPGVETPENIAKAREAIAAYHRVLESDPNNEEAYHGVAYLYGALKEDDRQADWILQRAMHEGLPPEERADAYTMLASKDWNCSQTITEKKENQQIVKQGERYITRYVKPKDPNEFERAEQCAAHGLELIENAISLNPNSELAWSYKTNLLREMVKLAEMDGDADKKADYTNQADEAQRQTSLLSEMKKVEILTLVAPHTENGGEAPPPPPTPEVKSITVSAGLLNGKAINKPAPSYPANALAARAYGTVAVQVLIDEDGKVVSAQAVSGPPLLQQAAVDAAYQAQFAPTMLSGQPVKISGVLTYDFTLPE